MWRTVAFASLTAAFLAFFPGDASAQKKKQPNMEVSDLATDKDYKQLQSVKDMTGKLAGVNTGSITFRLDIPHMEPNPNYKTPKVGNNNQYQQMQNIYRQQAQIMNIADPLQRQRRMQQLMGTMQRHQYQQMQQAARANNPNPNNQPFRLAHQYRDYELELSEKVVVRKLNLELEYNDKGEPKKYTKEELAELRGKDSGKPGYKATIDDLQVAQRVQIFLAMPRKSSPAADNEARAADKEAGAKEEVVKPLITMIVIVQPVDLSMRDTPGKKR